MKETLNKNLITYGGKILPPFSLFCDGWWGSVRDQCGNLVKETPRPKIRLDANFWIGLKRIVASTGRGSRLCVLKKKNLDFPFMYMYLWLNFYVCLFIIALKFIIIHFFFTTNDLRVWLITWNNQSFNLS
jgi:hypothetical protein